MTGVLGFDSAFCPEIVPAEIDGLDVRWCEVYIGGSSAYHPWSDGEIARVAHLPKLPVWVPTPGFENPAHVAMRCIARLRQLKIPAFAKPYRAVMWDLETGREPDAGWLAIVRDRMLAAGYDTMPYGSVSWLFGYPPYTGYVVADPTGRAHQYPRPGVACTQYAWDVPVQGGSVDLNMLDSTYLPHVGTWG